MEQMLENFHQMFVDLHRRVYQLQASMKSKREIMNIQVNSMDYNPTKDSKTGLGVANARRQSVRAHSKDWCKSLQQDCPVGLTQLEYHGCGCATP